MAAFFRGLLFFVAGAAVGAVAMLVFSPSFSVVVSRGGPAAKPAEVASAPVVAPAQAPAKAADAVVSPKPVVPAAAPVAAVAETPAEPAIDFKSVSEHLILWPNTVTVKSATVVAVTADGKKVQDLALEAGTVLQVSKVLADGTLEARAKGAKFEIKSALTDFSVELGKRVAELVAKGTKLDTPIAATSAPAPTSAPAMAAPAAPAVVASVAPVVPVVPAAVAAPKGPLTLAQRVDILFGNKPEASAPAPTPAPAAPAASVAPAPAAVVPSAPTAPAAVAPAADATAPKAAEKGKDLDRKMNQLFK